MKYISFHTERPAKCSSMVDKNTPIFVEFQNTRDKEKILQAFREKRNGSFAKKQNKKAKFFNSSIGSWKSVEHCLQNFKGK